MVFLCTVKIFHPRSNYFTLCVYGYLGSQLHLVRRSFFLFWISTIDVAFQLRKHLSSKSSSESSFSQSLFPLSFSFSHCIYFYSQSRGKEEKGGLFLSQWSSVTQNSWLMWIIIKIWTIQKEGGRKYSFFRQPFCPPPFPRFLSFNSGKGLGRWHFGGLMAIWG